MSTPPHAPVLQLRLVIEADDIDAAVAFYRDALGLTEQAAFEGDGGARVAILEAGRATLEIANPAQRRMIDDIEVGHDTGGAPRIALEVTDTNETTAALVDGGATLLGGPVVTPWRSLNARLAGPAGMQLTIFQELDAPGERAAAAGFGTSASRDASRPADGQGAAVVRCR